MGKVSNLIKGAGKNIAAAARTDGVMKAALKRTAVGAGIGAAAGGTMSAIQGGSFGEGAVRGGIMGGMAGAASSAYKMGAMGSQSIDSSGKFRKGATSVYSHLIEGNTTWDEVNKFRAKDADSFMNHIRSANDGQDLRARMIQMDGKAKTKNVGQIKDHSAGKMKRVKSQADTNPSTPKPEATTSEVSPVSAPEPTVGSQVNTNPSGNYKPDFVDVTPGLNNKTNFVDVTPNGYSTNYPSSNLMGLPGRTGTNIQQNYNMLSTDLPKLPAGTPKLPSQSSAVSGYLPAGTTQKHYNEFANSVSAYKNGGNRWNRIESEGRKIAQGLYNVDNVSTDQMVEGVSRFMESPAGQQMRKRYGFVNRGYESFLNGVTS